MLVLPVCVPSVCELHQEHELDKEEKKAANSSYVAPYCGIEKGNRQGN